MRIGAFVLAGLVFPPWVYADARASASKKEVLVRCDAGQKIGWTLSKLDKMRPNVVKVSGTCQENVLISGFDDLAILGKPGATLLPAPPATAYAIEVSASRAVSIEGLTIHVTDGRAAMNLAACQDCRLRNVTVDGGLAFYALDWSRVTVSSCVFTGIGNWAAVGAFRAFVDVQDSVFDGIDGSKWCGLCLGENATAGVYRSTFRNFGTGIGVDGGAWMNILEGVVIEDNWCFGASASRGGHLNFVSGGIIQNNSSTCWSGGINVDGTSTLSASSQTATLRITGNTGGGVKANHQALAQLGEKTVVTANNGTGLEVRNLSLAVAQAPVEISGNWGDLACDSISHINNGNQFIGAVPPGAQCPNFHPLDGP